jgi:hypothetical protein
LCSDIESKDYNILKIHFTPLLNPCLPAGRLSPKRERTHPFPLQGKGAGGCGEVSKHTLREKVFKIQSQRTLRFTNILSQLIYIISVF